MGISFIFHVPVSLFVTLTATSSGVADADLLRFEMIAVILVVIACGLAGWACDKRGQEGRWTAYLVIVVYGGWIASLVTALGVWSTPLIAFVPSSVILVTLWYDETIGWWAFIYSMFLLVVGTLLYTLTDFPYAPVISDRSLDAQRDTLWMLAMVGHFLGILLSDFLLAMLVVRARAVQDFRLHRAHALIRRYIPSQLAEKIIHGEHLADAKPERARLTVFFSDIEGFTEASDHLDPEDLAALLDEYLAEMMAIAERSGATVNQIVGDGIMAFFGAPRATSDKDHALRAVRMALEMQKRMTELKDTWIERGVQKPFRVRIGINTGHASVGDYGSPGRKLYSAIGVQTNLAARIQANCDPGKVLISHSTWALIHDEIACIDKGELQFKGVHHPVRVYEVSSTVI